jgi:hypothetical protein
VGLQPGGEAVAGAIGKEVDGAVAFQVDQDRPIRQPLLERPVIHAEDRRRGQHAVRIAPDEPQERIGADREPELARKPRPRFATIGAGHGGGRLTLAIGAPGVGLGDTHQPLGDDLPWAGGVGAEALAHDDLQAHDQRRPGQIRQGAGVPAVHAVGELAAQWARHGGRCGGRQDGQPLIIEQQRRDVE